MRRTGTRGYVSNPPSSHYLMEVSTPYGHGMMLSILMVYGCSAR